MPRYWVIAPVESKPADLFDKVWQYDLANNLISIGWKQLGDVSKMNREELAEAVSLAYPDKPPSTKSLFANMAPHQNLWVIDRVLAGGNAFFQASAGQKEGSLRTW